MNEITNDATLKFVVVVGGGKQSTQELPNSIFIHTQ